MAILEEFIDVFIYLLLGFKTNVLLPDQQGPIASRPWKENKQQRVRGGPVSRLQGLACEEDGRARGRLESAKALAWEDLGIRFGVSSRRTTIIDQQIYYGNIHSPYGELQKSVTFMGSRPRPE